MTGDEGNAADVRFPTAAKAIEHEVVMIFLKLDELKNQMILAKPVYNLQGVLLLEEGTELNEKKMWIMKSWGVRQVWVEGGPEQEKERENETEKEMKYAVQEALKEKFSGVLGDRVMAEIMRVARKQLEKRFQEKQEENGTH